MGILVARERWDKIARLVEKKGGASVEDIVRELDVSPATARRDLSKMHSLGLISRTRGGALQTEQVGLARPLDASFKIAMTEKEAIGRIAAGLIESGDTVIIDGGTTTARVAANIQAADVVVVTNAYTVLSAIIAKKNVDTIVIGGSMIRQHEITVGPDAVRMIKELRADKAIIGVTAISPIEGVTGPQRFSVEVKQAIAQRCEQLIVVADHTKLGKHSLFQTIPIETIDILVTDSGATDAQIREFQNAGVEVVIAQPDNRAANDNTE